MTGSSSAANAFRCSNGGVTCLSGTSAANPRRSIAIRYDWSSDKSGSTCRPLKCAKGDEFLSKFLLFCFGLISHVNTCDSKLNDSLVYISELPQLSCTLSDINLWISLKSALKGRCCYFGTVNCLKWGLELSVVSSEFSGSATYFWLSNNEFEGLFSIRTLSSYSEVFSETNTTCYISINAAKSYSNTKSTSLLSYIGFS